MKILLIFLLFVPPVMAGFSTVKCAVNHEDGICPWDAKPEPTPSPAKKKRWHIDLCDDTVLFIEGIGSLTKEECREYHQESLCADGRHNWQDSYWSMVNTSTKTVNYDEMPVVSSEHSLIRYGTQTIPGKIGNVQVCSRCRILRLKEPK